MGSRLVRIPRIMPQHGTAGNGHERITLIACDNRRDAMDRLQGGAEVDVVPATAEATHAVASEGVEASGE